MRHPNFTAERVAAVRCDPDQQQRIIWDGRTPGLGLRVTSAGSKSYIYEARLNGRTLRLTIGDARAWSVAQAQEEATRLRCLTDRGIDPRVERAEQRAKAEAERIEEQRRTALVREAWAAYMAHPAHQWSALYRRDFAMMTQEGGQQKKRGGGVTAPGVLHPLMALRLADVTTATLEAWIKSESPKRANKTRQGFEAFRTFWRWCGAHADYRTLIDAAAVESRDLRRMLPKRKSKRFDVLERGHMRAWFAAVRAMPNKVVSVYLQALVLTGARRQEMASLRWSDVDFAWGNIWLKDKVRAEGRKVSLTPYLASLLSALPRRNEWVFSSSTSASGRINEPRLPHKRALAVAGLNHVTLHGLRRTFASLAEWVEMPRGVVAQIMGHAPNATAEKHYINRPLDLLAVWHAKYEAWILKQAKVRYKVSKTRKTGRTLATVVSLRMVSAAA
jgi:integrase